MQVLMRRGVVGSGRDWITLRKRRIVWCSERLFFGSMCDPILGIVSMLVAVHRCGNLLNKRYAHEEISCCFSSLSHIVTPSPLTQRSPSATLLMFFLGNHGF